MIRNKVLLCAEAVIRDAEANTVSIINLTEGMIAQSFPVFVPKVSILGVFSRDKDDPQRAKVRFEAKIGTTPVFGAEGELNFEDKTNTRFIVNIIGFALTGPGQLSFTFYQDKKKLGSYEVPIMLKEGGPEIKAITGSRSEGKKNKQNKKKKTSNRAKATKA